jgi:phosphatidylglycerol---prolipoprotein diacylglyceryl transferase
MHPTFHLGPLDFPAYFTFLTIGYMLGVLLAWRESWKVPGVDPNKLLDMSIILLIAGLLGARMLHVVADGAFWDYVHMCTDPLETTGKLLRGEIPCITNDQCVQARLGELCHPTNGTCHPGQDCFRAFKIWYGGLAFYGGFIFAALVAVWFIRRNRDTMDVPRVADLAGFGVSLGLVFGRLGCWLAGCCFGATAEHGHGVSFPRGSPAWQRHVELDLITRKAQESLEVIPTQLIHVFSNLAIFVITYVMFKRGRRAPGAVFATFLGLYAISRFLIEFLRDDHRGIWLGGALSTSQLIGIPVIMVAAVIFYRLRKQKPGRDSIDDDAPEGPETTQEP